MPLVGFCHAARIFRIGFTRLSGTRDSTAVNDYSTKDLCVRFRCSSRTLFRRMKRGVNPFPLALHSSFWKLQPVVRPGRGVGVAQALTWTALLHAMRRAIGSKPPAIEPTADPLARHDADTNKLAPRAAALPSSAH
jgi:hypothetical protein